MRITKKIRLQILLQNTFFVILFIALMSLLFFLTKQYNWQKDFTSAKRNSISQASIDTLNQLQGPITITAFATSADPRLGDIRKIIRDFISPYQRKKPDLILEFIDPTEQPKIAEANNIQLNGELLIKHGSRSEHLTDFTEQAFVSLLMRLARTGERRIMYLEGHGEPRFNGPANQDLGEFNKHLSTKGFKSSPLNLAITQEIPSDTSLLVLTTLKTDLVKGEAEKLHDYLNRGGNLLWLIDQASLRGLQPLAEKLGLILSPGIVIDPAAQKLKAPVNWALGTTYGRHPITQNFTSITVFPFVRSINIDETSVWQTNRLIEVAPRGWVETGDINKEVSFDKSRDTRGPITIALTLSRSVKEKEQRVAVVGTGYFLANAFLGNGGNIDLGINMVSWLTGDESLITIQPRANIDSGLILPQLSMHTIVFTFLIALPVLFLIIAGSLWWYRRRA